MANYRGLNLLFKLTCGMEHMNKAACGIFISDLWMALNFRGLVVSCSVVSSLTLVCNVMAIPTEDDTLTLPGLLCLKTDRMYLISYVTIHQLVVQS